MLERFVSINVNGKNSYGIETEEGTINLSDHFPEWPTLLEVVQNKGFDKLFGDFRSNDWAIVANKRSSKPYK